ncbi:MAG: hypothetical protein M3M99_00360, partial [Actinomycetota bacterium]|nr:hypothetical protein [Actinomycetota bacterium]
PSDANQSDPETVDLPSELGESRSHLALQAIEPPVDLVEPLVNVVEPIVEALIRPGTALHIDTVAPPNAPRAREHLPKCHEFPSRLAWPGQA